MVWLWIVLAFAAGWCASAWWRRPRPAVAFDVRGMAPKDGMAVLVNLSGEDVSRRRLTEARNMIHKFHGKQAIDTYRYVGRRPNGDHEFRMGG